MLVVAVPSAFADDGDDGEEGTPKASDMKVEMLADFVLDADSIASGEEVDPKVTPDEAALADATASVIDLRTSGIGWGALFKIYKLAAAMGVDPSTLVVEIGPDGEFEFSFGELKNALTDEQRGLFDEMAKNFGTLQSSAKKAAKALDKAERDEHKADRKAERDARKAARDAAKAERGSNA